MNKEPDENTAKAELRAAMIAAEEALANARKDGLDDETIRTFEGVIERYRALLGGSSRKAR